MKILMMTNTYLPIVGGLENSIQSFSEHFRAKGHEVKIVAPQFRNSPGLEKDVIRVPSLERVGGTDFSIGLPLPEVIQELLKNFKPDIVHSHHPFLMGDLALRVCGQNKIPLVFTYHTMFEYYTDHFGMDQHVIQQFVVELAAGYANMADQLIAPSESVARSLRERNIQTPIAVVPTGIDVKRFSSCTTDLREKLKIPKSAFLLGHTGRLAPEKNLIFLTESVTEFLRNERSAHFLIIGAGPSEREMKKIFRSSNVLERVTFAGVLGGKKLIAAYRAMDVFVFASKSETQGMVVTEAMAAGVPVVALDAPGVREVVKDKLNGRLIAAESCKKFAAALAWYFSRTSAQKNKIKKNVSDTAQSFSMELCAEKALEVYQTVHLRRDRFTAKNRNQWETLLSRFKTEFGMFANLGWSAGAALVRTVTTERTTKRKTEELYLNEIKETLESWTLDLKKIRKRVQEAPEEQKPALEDLTADLARKIRKHEATLAELNRQVLTACDTLEKHISQVKQEIKEVFDAANNSRGESSEKSTAVLVQN